MNNLKAVQLMIEGKCPECHEGKMFSHPFYHPAKFREMHAECPACKKPFEKEPGFFWVSMYMSYILTVMMGAISGALICQLLGDPSIATYMVIIISLIVLSSTITFRTSRVLMLYLFHKIKKPANTISA